MWPWSFWVFLSLDGMEAAERREARVCISNKFPSGALLVRELFHNYCMLHTKEAGNINLCITCEKNKQTGIEVI